jgi:isocitrate/isopropylmalate dehydrogenase
VERTASSLRIGVIPGDGIGPEVINEGLKVLEEVARLDGLRLEMIHFPHGAEHLLATGELASEEFFEELSTVQAVYLGAVGDPRIPPRVLETGLLAAIARRFSMDISLRPYRLHAERLTPLRGRAVGDIDLLVIREAAEDFIGLPAGSIHPGTDHEVLIGSIAFSRRLIDRVVRLGFEQARERRSSVVVVDQSNAAEAHQIWRDAQQRIADDYPDVASERLSPDHFAMSLISTPERFDVVVTSWMLGGIFSDMAAALIGGLGMSGNVRLSTGDGPSMFEPTHGSAPKYAGRQVASPLGAIHAAELLLRHNGFRDSAERIAKAIAGALGDGTISDTSTRSGMSTAAQGAAILHRLQDGATGRNCDGSTTTSRDSGAD